MVCKKCNCLMPEYAKFCNNCGTPLIDLINQVENGENYGRSSRYNQNGEVEQKRVINSSTSHKRISIGRCFIICGILMAIAFVLCVFLLQAKVNDGIVGEWKLTDVYTNGVKVSIEDLLISGDTDNTVELTAYNDNTVIITNIFNSGTRELLYGNWYQSGDMYYLLFNKKIICWCRCQKWY